MIMNTATTRINTIIFFLLVTPGDFAQYNFKKHYSLFLFQYVNH